ncbi:MAG: hypothetical protein M3Y27_22055 [Acidobacteriota bacterium]|nr:hypothetical protein [Acidobacteriota bacterium]
MRIQIGILALFLATIAVASSSVPTYSEARASWEKSKDQKEYQTYAEKFSQFNNYYHLDEKDGCYALAGGPVQLNLCSSSLIETREAMPWLSRCSLTQIVQGRSAFKKHIAASAQRYPLSCRSYFK